jgi:Zn-dependent M28 family amino/carboxypeptidase
MITIQEDFTDKMEQIRSFIENPRMQLHSSGTQQYKKTVPNVYMSSKALVKYIDFERLESSATGKKATLDIKTTQVLNSENVLGFIQGTDLKDEIVIITAHYDHIGYDNGEICNGADDDGSGTVSLLEIAQAFSLAKKDGNGPRRSMLFMTVSGEEKGLLGSDYYSQNPVFPLENTVVDLNIDMIGRKDSLHADDNYVYLIGADRISKDLHQISEQVNTQLIQLKLDYTYNEESDPNHFYYRSDHYNFAKHNIPVIFYFSGVHEDYHKPTDDVEKILFPKLEKTARLIFFTAWEIANRTQRLRKNA